MHLCQGCFRTRMITCNTVKWTFLEARQWTCQQNLAATKHTHHIIFFIKEIYDGSHCIGLWEAKCIVQSSAKALCLNQASLWTELLCGGDEGCPQSHHQAILQLSWVNNQPMPLLVSAHRITGSGPINHCCVKWKHDYFLQL